MYSIDCPESRLLVPSADATVADLMRQARPGDFVRLTARKSSPKHWSAGPDGVHWVDQDNRLWLNDEVTTRVIERSGTLQSASRGVMFLAQMGGVHIKLVGAETIGNYYLADHECVTPFRDGVAVGYKQAKSRKCGRVRVEALRFDSDGDACSRELLYDGPGTGWNVDQTDLLYIEQAGAGEFQVVLQDGREVHRQTEGVWRPRPGGHVIAKKDVGGDAILVRDAVRDYAVVANDFRPNIHGFVFFEDGLFAQYVMPPVAACRAAVSAALAATAVGPGETSSPAAAAAGAKTTAGGGAAMMGARNLDDSEL